MRRPSLTTVRRCVQAVVLAVVALAPVLNLHGVHVVSGNFFFFEAFGLPLADPLAALQALCASGSVGGRALGGAAAVLGLAALLGPVFCSWACPYGLVGDLTQALRDKIAPPRSKAPTSGFATKLAVAAVGLLAAAAFGLAPLVSHLSLPGWFARMFQQPDFDFWILPYIVFALALVLDIFARERFWCRRVCPQSVLPVLMGRLFPLGLRVGYAAKRCTCGKDSPCREACGLTLDPRRPAGPELGCTNCGDCVTACAGRGGALSFTFGPRREQTKRVSTTPARQG